MGELVYNINMGNVGNIKITGQSDIRKVVKDAIINGIQRNGERIYDRSQQNQEC